MTATDTTERVRLAIYRRFSRTGSEATVADLQRDLDLDADTVEHSLAELHETRHIVRRDGHIVMAHPFASIPLGFSVMGPETLWWGGCAWDSFAIPHLVPGSPEVLVATTCAACGTAHAWTVDNTAPPAGDQVAHFLVPAAQIWDDVVHSCSHQRIFCSERCVDDWLAATGNQRGYVMSLETLWRLAQHWYEGRLDSPYRRREPLQASDYFRSVGLHGAFWGLPD
jgi:endogenous inhibitor of DNA gyrase (YacG/DUF329 family)